MHLALISIFFAALIEQAPIPVLSSSTAVDTGTKNQTREEETMEQYRITKAYVGELTAYSSRPEETDQTPHYTAIGSAVRWGIVATNAHPIGTLMRFPHLYGDRIFVVEDQMNARYKNRIDIWFPDHKQAQNFGYKITAVEIVKQKNHKLSHYGNKKVLSL